jgi:putative PEP-CTERM system histidine kinase
MYIPTITYAISALSFLAIPVLLVVARKFTRPTAFLFAACLLSALWAGAVLIEPWLDLSMLSLPAGLETVRTFAWSLFILAVLRTILPARTSYFRIFLLMIGAISALDLAFSVLAPAAGLIIPVDYALYLKISAAIIGGILLENLFRNTPADQIWSMKHICLGIGTIYGFDVFLYSDALLFRRIDPGLWAARGIVDALAVPLIALSAIRNPSLSIKIHMSRDAVFYSTTLLGAGIYFLLVGLAGYYIRAVGGNWGDVLSVIILTLSILLVITLLASSTFRSHIKLFINENFFSYKYDYRKEWAQLIKTISSDTDYVRLHKRVIKSLADVVDSPAGILWLHREPDQRYVPVENWHFPGEHPSLPADEPLMRAIAEQQNVVNLLDPLTLKQVGLDPGQDSWLDDLASIWLAVPLINRDELVGLVALQRPRAARDLNWEDYALLRIIGQQIASYIAEEEAMAALLDARQLEAFNKRFAFVIHDIKNLAGQLSLLIRNAEKFGDNPDFRRDLISTLKNSVGKMTALLQQLSPGSGGGAKPAQSVDLVSLVKRFVAQWPPGERRVVFSAGIDTAMANLAGEDKLTTVLTHLVQNAVEVTPEHGVVQITLASIDGHARIDVADQGPGMSPEFVRDELFRPFRTTKAAGYGIGAYQARETIRALGGRLEVLSAPGQGTTMRIVLPIRDDSAKPISSRGTAGV